MHNLRCCERCRLAHIEGVIRDPTLQLWVGDSEFLCVKPQIRNHKSLWPPEKSRTVITPRGRKGSIGLIISPYGVLTPHGSQPPQCETEREGVWAIAHVILLKARLDSEQTDAHLVRNMSGPLINIVFGDACGLSLKCGWPHEWGLRTEYCILLNNGILPTLRRQLEMPSTVMVDVS